MGGIDKPALVVRGHRMLDVALAAVAAAGRTVVVGPRRDTPRPVAWACEDPPGGGPAAALAAGLEQVEAPWVVVLAGDLPLVTTSTVAALRRAAHGHDGALLVDDAGRRQLLAGCWSTAALRAAVDRAGDTAGMSVRRLLRGLDVAAVLVDEPAWLDCDTPDDLRRLESP